MFSIFFVFNLFQTVSEHRPRTLWQVADVVLSIKSNAVMKSRPCLKRRTSTHRQEKYPKDGGPRYLTRCLFTPAVCNYFPFSPQNISHCTYRSLEQAYWVMVRLPKDPKERGQGQSSHGPLLWVQQSIRFSLSNRGNICGNIWRSQLARGSAKPMLCGPGAASGLMDGIPWHKITRGWQGCKLQIFNDSMT